MWIFTKYGFFSVVCAREGDGAHHRPVDSERVMIRARSRKHLDALRQRFPEQLSAIEILETPHADYRYRLIADKSAWLPVVQELAAEMGYDNFKREAVAFGGHDAYAKALHDVWAVMHKVQSSEK